VLYLESFIHTHQDEASMMRGNQEQQTPFFSYVSQGRSHSG